MKEGTLVNEEYLTFKQHLGNDILTKQIYCDWSNSIPCFRNEMIFGLMNCLLINIFDTVEAKFKKKHPSIFSKQLS